MFHSHIRFPSRAVPRALAGMTIGIAVGFAAACAVGPNYKRPVTEFTPPPGYKEAGEWKAAQPREDQIRGAWWEIFNDPDLNALEEQVGISNQNLAVAEAQLREARALVREARAQYFPSLSIGTSYTFSGNASAPRGTSLFSLPIELSWEPDIWGRIRRTVEASSANAQATEADLESARLLAHAEMAQDYFQLRTTVIEKTLLESTVAAYQKFLDLTRNRYEGGVASKADVLQAETQLKTVQAQAIDLGVQRAQMEHAIALLVGKPASLFSIPDTVKPVAPPDIPIGIPSDLLERRPDIAAAERRIAAANAQIGVAIAAYFPNITLNASLGLQSKNLLKWFSWPSRFFSVGPNISEVVFQGGLRKAQTDQARAAYDASVASYRQTVLTAFQEVEDNLAALRILENEAKVQEEAVKAAEQSLEVSVNQYKMGTASYLNVIVAQTTALNNERSAVDILNRRMVASVLLIKALGGGWNASVLSPVNDKEAKMKKPKK